MGKRSKADNLRGFLNDRIDDLRKQIPRTGKSWTKESIHYARVGTRRMRAAVDLLEPVLSAEPKREFAKVLKKLRKALGPLRDHDVMLEHLHELEGSKGMSEAVTWLVRQLRTGRTQLEHNARKLPQDKILSGLGKWWSVEVEIDEIEQAAQMLARTVLMDQLKAFSLCANRIIEARASKTHGSSEDVHALRITGKHLRYALELAQPLGYAIPKSVFKAFKRLQDALGLWHDFVVLGQCALEKSVECELALHYPPLHGEVLELARFCFKHSEQQLDRFTKLWSRNGEKIASQIEEILNPEEPRKSVVMEKESKAVASS